MIPRDPAPGTLVGRIALIAVAAALMIGDIVALDRATAERAARTPALDVGRVVAASMPIAAEADVFRTSRDVAEMSLARRAAHPRNFATYRGLRAYPGAPPRIPHGLTRDELRTTACRTCHERGGYVSRFGAYAPVTPHPELDECLQCHLPDDALLAISLPGSRSASDCRQCHAAIGAVATTARAELDWRPAPWPIVEARSSADAVPPPIPHGLQFRGNCNACHAGPAAVAEIRTTHPERTDCRQCHVALEPDVAPFARPIAGGVR